MELLKQRILQDGRLLPSGVLKVDRFLNHQLDATLMFEVAKEFGRLFADCNFNKIVTIEASGIAPAIMMGYQLQLPVVFIKKARPKTMDKMLVTEVRSFTKNTIETVCVSSDFLTADDHVLFIDDLLAYGNASNGMIALAKQAGATIEGMGFVIEKGFQGGGDRLREAGYNVKSLAIIDSLDNNEIRFR